MSGRSEVVRLSGAGSLLPPDSFTYLLLRQALCVACGFLALLGIAACTVSETSDPALPALFDLEDRPVDPLALAREAATATVFLFTRADCPISNRYAPEVLRLAERFGPQGVHWVLVYPNPDATEEDIREHLEAYGYADSGEPLSALQDPDQVFTRVIGAEVTPEAAVLDTEGRLVYRGRIDDRWVSFGQLRAAPTRRDLEEVLTALVAGERVEPRTTRAVGCLVEDLS